MNICLVFKSSTFWPVSLGILEVLDREEIPFHSILGGGAGGLLGALYSFCPDARWLVEYSRQLVSEDRWKYFSFEKYPLEIFRKSSKTPFPFQGNPLFVSHELEDLFPPFLKGKRIENSLISLGLVAMDLRQGVPFLISEGPVEEALLGTLAFPGLFPYHLSTWGPLMDPYLVQPLSVGLAWDWGADVVLALNPKVKIPFFHPAEEMNSLETLSRIHYLNMNTLVSEELKKADYAIEVELPFVEKLDGETFESQLEAGRKAGEENLAALLKLMEDKDLSSWRT